MVSYARELFRAILHSPWIYAAALLLCLFLWLPLAGVGSTAGADMVESYVTQHAQDIGPRIQMLQDSGAADNIINLWKEAQQALDEAGSSPRGSAEQLRALGRYCQAILALCDAGYFAGTDEAMIRANSLTMVRVGELQEPVVYGTTHQMGAWPYLAVVYGQVPPLLWLAIAAEVAGVGVSRQEPKGLLGQCPMNSGAKALASIGVTTIVAWLLMMAACVVAFCQRGLAAGFGDPGYPAVFVQGQQVLDLTAAQVLGRAAVLLLIQCACCASLAQLALSLGAKRQMATAIACLPILGLFAVNVLAEGASAWNPAAYFDLWPIAGGLAYFNGEALVHEPGVSWEQGLLVLGLWCLAVATASVVGNLAARSTRV
ncbi:hypothetical protein AAK684_04800 [Leptogranulimonas caecicola]|uniref:ABC-2 type transport system permease protein n=1 Tax=Leptogranulimonas caecicola TaxID=2894156 RepID=A0AAU9CKQ2_9ACTN|nr:hypothetical protein [Leptogranulimonas caecicola]BDC91691.1 hypothetical protein ATTO_15630 [Leptogranulimonas caecicola]